MPGNESNRRRAIDAMQMLVARNSASAGMRMQSSPSPQMGVANAIVQAISGGFE